MTKKKIVISGINMVEGGIFTILDNVLKQFSEINNNNQFELIALVNNAESFNYPNIKFIGFPKSKKYWFYRLYYEYYYFKKLSNQLKPNIWLSMHDVSPNVNAKKQFTYFHHPNTLHKVGLKDWCFDYKVGVFSLLYDLLFKINIKKNQAVFVQQNWIKNVFENRFKINNIKVATPKFIEEITTKKLNLNKNKIHFFYPSFPRSLKNHELIFEAINLLPNQIIEKTQFHFTTIKNNKHKYAQFLTRRYGNLKNIILYDELSRNEVLCLYNSINCLVFPSKIETWGLPITEAKAYKKDLLLANMPYAKETCGNYENVSFFDVEKPAELAKHITEIVNKTHVFQGNIYNYNKNEVIENWKDFVTYIIKN